MLVFKGRDVKRTRRQTVEPAQGAKKQSMTSIDDDDEGLINTMRGDHYSTLSDSHTAKQHTLLASKMEEFTICKNPHQALWPTVVIFESFGFHCAPGENSTSLHRAFFYLYIPHHPFRSLSSQPTHTISGDYYTRPPLGNTAPLPLGTIFGRECREVYSHACPLFAFWNIELLVCLG